jgi:DNA segregation ATPase FtsK/SpoIIIE, S-DNA-T family
MAANSKRRTPARRGARARPSSRGRSGRGRRQSPLERLSSWLGIGGLGGWPRGGLLPVLSQRQRDVLGLGLLALGIFMGFVLYGGWNGGVAGHALAAAMGFAVGGARALAPAAMLAAGGVLLSAPLMPPAKPLRTGAICLSAAIVLALAAGTLGISAGQQAGGSHWAAHFLEHRGGLSGQVLYEVAHHLFQSVGVDILVVFLLLAGLVLLTGASIATVLRSAGGGLIDTTRVVRRIALSERERGAAAEPVPAGEQISAHSLAGQMQESGGWPSAQRDSEQEISSVEPPEPEPGKLVVRATHVEAPSLDGLSPDSDPWKQDEEPDGQADAEPDAEQGGQSKRRASRSSAQEQAPSASTDASADATPVDPAALTPQGRLREVVTGDPDFVWKLPEPTKVLSRSAADQSAPDVAGQQRIASSLTEALGHFGVQAKVIGTVAGPHITRYELRLAPGIKVGKVAQLKDDLAYALAATDIRILAPIPGKQAVGVEVPNAKRRIVRLGDVFQQPPPDWSPLTVWLGKDIAGKAIGADLAKMPHLLVAGTTGAGKSGAINAMLCSVLLKASPHEVRMVLVDPKQVELNHYESIPHLLTPVITSPKMAANALQNLVREMEQRYGIMSLARTRSLVELNKARDQRGEPPLPYILCVIDELADLMMVAPADVEDSIIRLAQKARAVGIHLVLATQSPRVDVITGMIKANVPSRIAFAVSSQTDSRVILDQNGAESLLGQGDMLFSPVGSSRLQRIQGAYIDEPQIAKLTDLWRRQGEPELHEELLEEVEPADDSSGGGGDELDPDEDPLLSDAIRLVAEMQTASTSMLQRRLRLGYTRAGRLIDMLERRGVISGYEGSKPRQVLIIEADVPRVLAMLQGGEGTSQPMVLGTGLGSTQPG